MGQSKFDVLTGDKIDIHCIHTLYVSIYQSNRDLDVYIM